MDIGSRNCLAEGIQTFKFQRSEMIFENNDPFFSKIMTAILYNTEDRNLFYSVQKIVKYFTLSFTLSQECFARFGSFFLQNVGNSMPK